MDYGDGGAVGAVIIHRRAEWAAKPARGAGLPMPRIARGVAIHWPATAEPVRDVPAALRGWQDFHMNGRGWSDLAYQWAVDQRGELWELRGWGQRSAANGTAALNAEFGAILAVLAEDERPTPAMLDGLREAVRSWRRVFPLADDVVCHGDIRPGGTECPGPILRKLVHAGELEPRDTITATTATIATMKGSDVLIVRCTNRGTAILSGPVFVGLGSAAERSQAERLAASGVPAITVETYTWDELDRRSKHATTPAGK